MPSRTISTRKGRRSDEISAAEGEHLSGRDEGIVIPFHLAKASLWAAQREWMQSSGPLLWLATHVAEELDRAERGLKAVEAALDDPGASRGEGG
jgi:hypothetical protein